MAKRSRTERREREREAQKLARARVKLADLEPGGAADRPIEVASASVIEPHALSMPCAACGTASIRVDEHIAVTVGEAGDERRLRVVRARCATCGHRRDVYFRIGTTLAN
jgi:hypothetical protein